MSKVNTMEGNPQQFVKDLVWCAVALMLVSYVGATVSGCRSGSSAGCFESLLR